MEKSEYETLCRKIDNLENKLDNLMNIISTMQFEKSEKKTKPEYTPNTNYQEWVSTFVIKREHLTTIFKNNIMDGFKECLEDNIIKGDLPIWAANTRVKLIYIFEEDEWRHITTEDIHTMIEIIWRKMLEMYFIGGKLDSEESEEERDINKKILIDMRKKMVDKHSKTIEKYLINKFKC